MFGERKLWTYEKVLKGHRKYSKKKCKVYPYLIGVSEERRECGGAVIEDKIANTNFQKW